VCICIYRSYSPPRVVVRPLDPTVQPSQPTSRLTSSGSRTLGPRDLFVDHTRSPPVAAASIRSTSHRCCFDLACLSSSPLRSDVPPIIIHPIWRASHFHHTITSFSPLPAPTTTTPSPCSPLNDEQQRIRLELKMTLMVKQNLEMIEQNHK
jgi:hypothetical protein